MRGALIASQQFDDEMVVILKLPADFHELFSNGIRDFMSKMTLRNILTRRHLRICYSFRNAMLSNKN